jgi:hypothetical protein
MTRVLLAVVLLLLVLVCGIHVAGAHHDTDLDGVGLADGLISFSLVVTAVSLLAAGFRRRRSSPSTFGLGQPVIAIAREALVRARFAFLGLPQLR